jgi:hypothetical protein
MTLIGFSIDLYMKIKTKLIIEERIARFIFEIFFFAALPHSTNCVKDIEDIRGESYTK